MSSRRRSRQRALQILFQWETCRQPADEVIDAYYDTLFSEEQPGRDVGQEEDLKAACRLISRSTAHETSCVRNTQQNWKPF